MEERPASQRRRDRDDSELGPTRARPRATRRTLRPPGVRRGLADRHARRDLQDPVSLRTSKPRGRSRTLRRGADGPHGGQVGPGHRRCARKRARRRPPRARLHQVSVKAPAASRPHARRRPPRTVTSGSMVPGESAMVYPDGTAKKLPAARASCSRSTTPRPARRCSRTRRRSASSTPRSPSRRRSSRAGSSTRGSSIPAGRMPNHLETATYTFRSRR